MVLDLWASNSFLLSWQTLTYLRVQMAMWTPGEVDMSCENQVDTQGTRHVARDVPLPEASVMAMCSID